MKNKIPKPKKRNSFTPLQINQNIQNIFKNYIFKYSKRKFVTGFTLVELLMVVVIIAILATILYPQFEGFRTRARLKEVENTVQLIRAAERLYYFKIGNWYTWDWDPEVITNDYSNVEDDLHIEIPSIADEMCQYRVFQSGNQFIILFRSNEATPENQGDYVLEDTVTSANTDTYDIDSYDGKWEVYLKYLE